jgi:Tol biopolymer transport system component
LRSGRRQIWSLDPAGGRHIPLTEGASDAGRPVVSPDGKSVAFIASRDGRRGIWMVPSEGGSARRLVQADAVDFVSWAPDNRRLVYAAPDGADLKLWVMSIDGSAPAPIAGVSGRVPAWSRTGDVIAYVATRDDLPELRFVSTDGREARAPAPLGEVGVPTAIGWSPDGAQIALVNLPGREAAEAWLLTIGGNGLRKLAEFSAPAELEGIAWTPDGRSVLVGRRDFETEVVLIDGLKSGTQRAGR